MTLIPYGRQYIDKADILSVKKSLYLEKITTGNKVINFEKKFLNLQKQSIQLFVQVELRLCI